MYKADYKQIAATPSFQAFLKQKRAFIVPSAIFFFVFYFSLPVLTSYFTFLNAPAIGGCFMGLAVRHRPIRYDLDTEYCVFPESRSFRSVCKRFKRGSEG